ncbi:ketopantoate reductase family protein [Paenibacillus massiliensis]|uniref:ketopantoate reductase family protein n=1 Tax=Paenibacillus massiliensis TaxID=225917 RepID=UPI00035E980B|nr:2-dehydropantoate 2-reductase [Paenibacillus massiliensis]
MQIQIIGGGALGLLLTGRLVGAGNEVTLWVRTLEQAHALETKGVTVIEQDGRQNCYAGDRMIVRPMQDWNRIHGNAHGQVSPTPTVVLLATKQGAVENIAASMNKAVNNLHIICFQNGVGHIEKIASLLPWARVRPAVTTEGAKRLDATTVVHAGSGETEIGNDVARGEAEEASSLLQHADRVDELDQALIALFNEAGFSSHMSNEIDTAIYRKLLFNSIINPLTAIWRITNGKLLQSERRIRLMKELYNEAIIIYQANGIATSSNWWEELLSVCRATAANQSSMLADVLHERQTEIMAINGGLVHLAAKAGIAAPSHRMLLELIAGIQIEER